GLNAPVRSPGARTRAAFRAARSNGSPLPADIGGCWAVRLGMGTRAAPSRTSPDRAASRVPIVGHGRTHEVLLRRARDRRSAGTGTAHGTVVRGHPVGPLHRPRRPARSHGAHAGAGEQPPGAQPPGAPA